MGRRDSLSGTVFGKNDSPENIATGGSQQQQIPSGFISLGQAVCAVLIRLAASDHDNYGRLA